MTPDAAPPRPNHAASSRPAKKWLALLGALVVVGFQWAQRQLAQPDLSGTLRWVWLVAPLVVLVAAGWAQWQQTRHDRELELAVSGRAALQALAGTLLGLAIVGQVDAAYGLARLGWKLSDLWTLPLFLYMGCWVWSYRKYHTHEVSA